MSFHGVQLLGISIVLAAISFGSTYIGTNGGVYTPSEQVAGLGVIITLIGVFADPFFETLLPRLKR